MSENLINDVVNSFYASLHAKRRDRGDKTWELDEYIDKVRTIRSKIGEFVKQEQEKSEDCPLIVQVTLDADEKCYMLVDIGASVVSISPEMVKVLDMEENIGDEVEYTVN